MSISSLLHTIKPSAIVGGSNSDLQGQKNRMSGTEERGMPFKFPGLILISSVAQLYPLVVVPGPLSGVATTRPPRVNYKC